MRLEGGCHCGAVRYAVEGEPKHVAICHCSDCRRSSGAPMVSWAAYAEAEFALTQGALARFSSNGTATRDFCPKCGTGIAYRNQQALPGLVDVQSATLDDPAALVPQAQIMVAERIGWMEDLGSMHTFEAFPGA